MGAQFANVIHGITDPYARQQVTQAVVHNLSNVYKPIPQGEPATNDSAPANAYDNTRVLTAGEQRKLMADALYHTANTWAHNENYDPVTRVFNAVRDAAQLFEFGDDHNVPPMRLIPQPFVEPVMETETQQQWLLHTPMPSATQASSIVRSFDTLVETLGTRRAEAAKKMFGT
jgi:hypothetical protein